MRANQSSRANPFKAEVQTHLKTLEELIWNPSRRFSMNYHFSLISHFAYNNSLISEPIFVVDAMRSLPQYEKARALLKGALIQALQEANR
jgi:hypothetical protein